MKPPNPDLEPGEINFGYGFKVKVVVTKKPIRGADGQWEGVEDSTYPMMIRLSPNIPLWRKHEVLAHETVHAALDYFQWVRDNLVDEMKREALETEKALKEEE